ncbi:hypothetical protein CKAN_02392500 [Cinnamomum micranthum f. kanehirae]|nr:hypothetical protein CKAN_02392500 [Cinnamomum micranthum f. kanehirae]
MGLLSVS